MVINVDYLKEELETFIVIDSDIFENDDFISKIEELMNEFKMKDEIQFCDTFVAFLSETGNQSRSLNWSILDKFQKSLMKSSNSTPKVQSSKSKTVSKEMHNPKIESKIEDDVYEVYGNISAESPNMDCNYTPKSAKMIRRRQQFTDLHHCISSPSALSPITGERSADFGQRTNSMHVLTVYGKTIDVCDESLQFREICDSFVQIDFINKEANVEQLDIYRFMYQKTADILDAVDEHILQIAEQMLQNNAEIEQFASSCGAHNESRWIFGQICYDAGNSRLRADNVKLQMPNFSAIALDLSHLEKYSLFVGQVVAVYGTNPTGDCFIAENLISGLLPKRFDIKQNVQTQSATETLNIMLAAAPFTTSENQLFDPLDALIKLALESKPHCLILFGPFWDSSNPENQPDRLMRQSCDLTYQELYDQLIRNIEEKFMGSCIKVIVVANHRELSSFGIYPTPSLCNSVLKTKDFQHVTLAGDPCFMSIAGVQFAMTSTDILRQLTSDEIACVVSESAGEPRDRIACLLRHILTQQSMYPVYPPSDELVIEWKQWLQRATLSFLPHVLLVPSELRYFVKEVDGVVCVNPNRLCKGRSGGTFAALSVAFSDDQQCKPVSVIAEIRRI